jgi:hypothetical protein
MPAITQRIADAILSELVGHTFSSTFTAARKYVPQFDLRDIDGIQISVVPRSVTIANADRSRTSHEVSVDVAVQRKVTNVLPSEIDPLMDLVQEVADFLTRLRLSNALHASWLRIANTPIYSPEHMVEKRMFTSVLTVTYIVHR